MVEPGAGITNPVTFSLARNTNHNVLVPRYDMNFPFTKQTAVVCVESCEFSFLEQDKDNFLSNGLRPPEQDS